MATTREGQRGALGKMRRSFGFAGGTVMIIFGAPEEAATLIFSASSEAICCRRPDAASCGLVTKSNAPSDSAFRVREAPSSVCALTTITGT